MALICSVNNRSLLSQLSTVRSMEGKDFWAIPISNLLPIALLSFTWSWRSWSVAVSWLQPTLRIILKLCFADIIKMGGYIFSFYIVHEVVNGSFFLFFSFQIGLSSTMLLFSTKSKNIKIGKKNKIAHTLSLFRILQENNN